MDMLNDPEMKDIVDGFCEESTVLIAELQEILDEMEDEYESAQMEKFGQVVDRIMGAAKSIGAEQIGTYSELLKTIGYKASQTDKDELIQITIAILFDATDIIQKMVKSIQKGLGEKIEFDTQAFSKRLRWLTDKYSDIKRSSVEHEGDTGAWAVETDINKLLDKMGL